MSCISSSQNTNFKPAELKTFMCMKVGFAYVNKNCILCIIIFYVLICNAKVHVNFPYIVLEMEVIRLTPTNGKFKGMQLCIDIHVQVVWCLKEVQASIL